MQRIRLGESDEQIINNRKIVSDKRNMEESDEQIIRKIVSDKRNEVIIIDEVNSCDNGDESK